MTDWMALDRLIHSIWQHEWCRDDHALATKAMETLKVILAERTPSLAALQSAPVSSSSVEEARQAAIFRVCYCQATAEHNHSTEQCTAFGVAKIDALIASVRAEGAQEQQILHRLWTEAQAQNERLSTRLQITEQQVAEGAQQIAQHKANFDTFFQKWAEAEGRADQAEAKLTEAEATIQALRKDRDDWKDQACR